MRRAKAPRRWIRIHQGPTTAVFFWMRGRVPAAVTCKHHDVDPFVYFRGGRKKCINRFRSRAAATGSM